MAHAPSPFGPLGLGAAACRLLSNADGALEPPLRSVIFGAARWSEHGRSLAQAQEVAGPREPQGNFFPRLYQNLQVLRDSRSVLEEHARQGHHLAPAAAWLIDHAQLLERQFDTVRSSLPRRYFQKLPRLRDAPLAGLPRIYGLAWAWVAHTDSGLDEELLELFLGAYQSQRELTLAELWAIPTTLRVVLMENLRRLAERAAAMQAARDAAHRWVERTPQTGDGERLEAIGQALAQRGVLEAFALQLQRRGEEFAQAAAPELRAWLAIHLSDPAGALQRQQKQAAEDHQSVRNAVTSLQGLDRADWRGVLLRSSAALADLQRLTIFAAEAEITQDLTLHDIEKLARRAAVPESRVSAALARLAEDAQERPAATPAGTRAAPGATGAPQYWLRGPGRGALLRELRLPDRLERWRPAARRAATPLYLLTLTLATAALVAVLLRSAVPGPQWPLLAWGVTALLLAWPASEAVLAVLHRLISESIPPRHLPRLALDGGIPASHRPLVVMPVMLTSVAGVQALADQLEQHHLANPERHAQFALLSDWADAEREHMPTDKALLLAARQALERLNRCHPAPPGEPRRFLLLHRQRRWSDSEQLWMGWERKRGKIEELLVWLVERGESPFVDLGPLSGPAPGIRSLVTLDSDTDMPPGRLRELVAIAAHPLNTPVFDPRTRRVVAGYAILQPRVVVPLPHADARTPFHWLFSGQWGIDPYSVPSSEIYQDLFDEGTYTGKGLLDVQAVHATLAHRLPQAQVLSHDLLEGALARCAAVSDVTLVEDAPTHPDVAASRLHRWMRGDWQLLPFIVRPRRWPMAGINRWKMLDNLRRSLVAPASLALLLWVLASGVLPIASALALVAAAYGAGPLLGAVAALAPSRDDISLGLFYGRTGAELLRALAGAAWQVLQLLSQALLSLDAVVRALARQFVSRRALLQWTTSAAAQAAAHGDLPALLQRHRAVVQASGVILVSLLALLALRASAALPGWPVPATPLSIDAPVLLCLLWAASPLWTWLASLPIALPAQRLDDPGRERLRAMSLDTWSFYARYVGETDHHLPPDNVQFTGVAPMVAHRTSPTNIGLYLLATAAARELGFIDMQEMVRRLEHTLATLGRLPRWRGHFYNWYDTQTLAMLTPAYVSTVDSGNLSGHLLVLSAACRKLATQADWGVTQRDALALSARRLAPLAATLGDDSPALAAMARQAEPGSDQHDSARLRELLAQARRELDALLQGTLADGLGVPDASDAPDAPDAVHRLLLHLNLLEGVLRDPADDPVCELLQPRLLRLAAHAGTLALAADFSALYDPRRHLLHIGYDVDSECLDSGYYDLLASEARLASLVAIAKGDVPPRHWAALGRPLFAAASLRGGFGVGLKSWSGSMFEYLMPSLVLEEPAGSLLYQATRTAVALQRADAAERGLPWGVSESAIAAQDHTLAYQYGPQGVARLALRRTPADERVIAPYASALALLVVPQAALANLAALERLGARRSLGFIEALDYTPRRQPAGAAQAGTPVLTFMAHHQAMSLLACTHVLTGGVLHRWAALSPHLRAVLALLHERAPHQAPLLREPTALALQGPLQGQRWQFESQPRRAALAPTHLLGNERYAVALRANGAGRSQWQGHGLTRWRDDALRDGHGLFGYVCRTQDRRWRALSANPAPEDALADEAGAARAEDRVEYSTEFHPDRVLLHARLADLTATTTVSVSTMDDCELRHVELHNTGRRPLHLRLAMAFEPTLAPQLADEAHPAFSNLFVQARWSAAERAMFLQRRPRLAHEAALHAVHFLAACDDPLARVQACAERSRWLGRLGSAAEPQLMPARTEDAWQTDADSAEPGQSTELPTGLDPVSVITVALTIAPHCSRKLSFGLAAAHDPDTLRALVDRYRQPATAERALALSDTLARIRLRELRLDPESWVAWLHLNTLLVSSLTRALATPAPGDEIDRRRLWRHGIGGERPILALWIEGSEGLDLARQLVNMLALWSAAGQALDLVVINAEPPSYDAPVQRACLALRELAALHLDPQRPGERQPALKLLQARDLQGADLATLRLLARVMLQADGRALAQQVERLRALHEEDRIEHRRTRRQALVVARADATERAPEGRFDAVDAAFHFELTPLRQPLRPWVNVLANPDFGCQVSEAAGGHTWAGNSRLHQITAGANDPLCDPPVEALWLEDLASGRVWWLGRGALRREVVHGIGSTRMRQVVDGLAIELEWCVDAHAAVRQLRVNVALQPGAATSPRRLRLVGFAEWTMGAARSDRASVITRPYRWLAPPRLADEQGMGLAVLATQRDASAGHGGATAFLCWRPCPDPSRPDAPATAWIELDDWTCDRREFFDAGGRWVLPQQLGARAGAGLDPCGAVACRIKISAGHPAQAALLLGHADSAEAAARLAQEACAVAPPQRLAQQLALWPALLDSVSVRTPDPLFDALVNRWLPYQAIACRLWARAGYYQAGGAWGFRDQLQDAMNLAARAPQLLRQQLRIHAARQFAEGDVQHWWHPSGGAGVRTRISDDLLWLPLALAHAVQVDGGAGAAAALLDEPVPFLRGAAVPAGQDDLYETPTVSDERASLFEHGARAIDHSLATLGQGAHGLPLMGGGDWNDGMNRVGHEGRGESVWLAWFLCRVIDDYAPLAASRGENERVQRWRAARAALVAALERHGWDGQWYRRAFFDDGTPLGSVANSECRIDLIAQAWSVLSGAGDANRAALAMQSARTMLWEPTAGVMRLLDPPLAQALPEAGYIQSYPGGVRENGGQYNHAAVWALMACAQQGDAAWAWRLFEAMSPAHRSADPVRGPLYGLEPYVMAGDIDSQPPYAGRGGWSWYTGAAAWLQRAALESICGLRLQGARLTLAPCLPPHWPRAALTLRRPGRTHPITLLRREDELQALLAQNPLAQRLRPGEPIDLDRLPDGCPLLLLIGAVSAPAPPPARPVAGATGSAVERSTERPPC